VLCAAVLIGCAAGAAARELPAHPSNHVVDAAFVIKPATVRLLNARLAELKAKTGYEVVVATVNNTAGEPIENFSLRVAERWQLGKKGQDLGVLVLIAVQDHTYRFEVGYGAEAVLNDGFCGGISREHFVPAFRSGDYSGGLERGLGALADAVLARVGAAGSAAPAPAPPGPPAANAASSGSAWPWYLDPRSPVGILVGALLLALALFAIVMLIGFSHYMNVIGPNRDRQGWNGDVGDDDGAWGGCYSPGGFGRGLLFGLFRGLGRAGGRGIGRGLGGGGGFGGGGATGRW
jgi:uncharacterized protein